MTTEQWLEKATDYFSGIMSAEEAMLFEKETVASDELTRLMQLWKTTDEEAAIYEQYKTNTDAFIATHQKLKPGFIEEEANKSLHISKRIASSPKKLRIPAWQWVAAAAVITGVIFSVVLLIRESNNNQLVYSPTTDTANRIGSNDSANNLINKGEDIQKTPITAPETRMQYEKLYAANFTPDEVPENQGGPLENAFFYYASAQYKNAIQAIDKAKNATITRGNDSFTPLTNFYAQYYKALSMMSLGNATDAIQLLQNCMSKSPSEMLKAKAQWYLSLAYIKQEKISSATETLRLLINNPSAQLYKSKAENLLAALKK